ncbi:hypothetical protein ACH5RR_006183 [Cinchona calisaya]|uniref:Uncharacterized protein n=1 Tax=Cinchona calisaya TaxID=153742 RepID=A0ABD3ANH8_9GENT
MDNFSSTIGVSPSQELGTAGVWREDAIAAAKLDHGRDVVAAYDSFAAQHFIFEEPEAIASSRCHGVTATFMEEENAVAVQSEGVACFKAAPLPNSIHHVKFGAALSEDKNIVAIWMERKEKAIVVHEVVAETVATPRPIINGAVCLGLVDDSIVIGSKIQHFAAAMGKNKAATA